ncbi:MAG: hypothetical protein WC998_04075 [Candidatus Paceibacterota bacterium]
MPALNYFFNTTDNLSSVVVNETFTYSHVPATPVFMWQIISVLAAIFVILSLYIKLRDENGSINPSRVGFSLVGAITCGFAAWISLAIDLPEGIGSGTVVVENISTFYSVSQHMIYEGYACVVLFVVLGLLCVGNLVYTLTLPEILKPDEREFNTNQKQKKGKKEEDEE